MSDTVNAATDVVADVAEEVAEQATNLAQASRSASSHNVGLALGSAAIGAGLGVAFGYILAKRTLETKYSQLAADEIAEMRQHYAAKSHALIAETGKGDLENIVKERGYAPEPEESERPPMAVAPPAAVTEAAEEQGEEEVREGEITEPTEVRNIFEDSKVEYEWDYHKERAARSPMTPYVIHRDEREDNDAYDEITWTYYEEDDVLCNELDEIIDATDRERIIGEVNLERFGHGSGDASIVYVRNDNLEMDVEIIKSPNSYAEEVHGLSHSSSSRRRERMRFDDE